MISKRQILTSLTKEQLLGVAAIHEINLPKGIKVDEIKKFISRKHSVQPETILTRDLFSRDDLKKICRNMNLNDSGKSIQDIINRIIESTSSLKTKLNADVPTREVCSIIEKRIKSKHEMKYDDKHCKNHSVKNSNNGYTTSLGEYTIIDSNEWIASNYSKKYLGKVDLILTSPPFPLLRKKAYGNFEGDQYLNWISNFFMKCLPLLKANGSIVIEMGNSWNLNSPTMSTLPMESLLKIKRESNLFLCQEFICHNPARLPSPVQYVNVDRTRVKDSWTRIWWLSKSENPYSDNRNILLPYSKAMINLLKKGKYNSGKRPSEHHIGETSFLRDNGGAIPASCLTDSELEYYGSLIISSNTVSSGAYFDYCKNNNISPHPARMQLALAYYFISLLTKENDVIFDPFAGSNVTGFCSEILKRKWIATEINDSNLNASKARFSEYAK